MASFPHTTIDVISQGVITSAPEGLPGGSGCGPPYRVVKPKLHTCKIDGDCMCVCGPWRGNKEGFAFLCDFPVSDHGSSTLLTLRLTPQSPLIPPPPRFLLVACVRGGVSSLDSLSILSSSALVRLPSFLSPDSLSSSTWWPFSDHHTPARASQIL